MSALLICENPRFDSEQQHYYYLAAACHESGELRVFQWSLRIQEMMEALLFQLCFSREGAAVGEIIQNQPGECSISKNGDE